LQAATFDYNKDHNKTQLIHHQNALSADTVCFKNLYVHCMAEGNDNQLITYVVRNPTAAWHNCFLA